MNNVLKMLLSGLLAGAFYLLPLSAMADEEPGPLAEMWLVTVDISDMGKFQSALKDHLALRTEKGDPWKWQVYTTVVGENLDQIAIRYCCISWADVDSYAKWENDNPEIFTDWMEKVDPYVNKTERYFEQMDWKNSHWAEEANTSKLFGVTEWVVKGEHGVDFAAAREKMSQIAINQGWATDERNWIWATTIGGRKTESVVVPYENYAAMAPDEESFYAFLTKQLGSEEAAAELLKAFNSATWGSSYTVWQHRPDLSMGE